MLENDMIQVDANQLQKLIEASKEMKGDIKQLITSLELITEMTAGGSIGAITKTVIQLMNNPTKLEPIGLFIKKYQYLKNYGEGQSS